MKSKADVSRVSCFLSKESAQGQKWCGAPLPLTWRHYVTDAEDIAP